ncbi:MAG: hypothetical protein WC916_01220 [Candidatus Woesearchaeota archaeon]
MTYIELKDPTNKNALTAIVNTANGQLFSINHNGDEYMHAGGRAEDDILRDTRGWSNSELIMFPIVSKSQDNTILYDGKTFPLGQHGIIRAMTPSVEYNENHPEEIDFVYCYTAETSIDNSLRFNKDSTNPQYMTLPIGFKVRKKHIVIGDALETRISVENNEDKPFCYALGWHPAFLTHGNSKQGRFYGYGGTHIGSLKKIMEASKSGAHALKDKEYVKYINKETGKGVELETDFGNIMLWSPASHLVCIEPITDKCEKGALIDLSPHESYNHTIYPGEKSEYTTLIRPI